MSLLRTIIGTCKISVLVSRNRFARHCWDHLHLGAHRTESALSLCSLGSVGSFKKKKNLTVYYAWHFHHSVSCFLRIITTYCSRNDSSDYSIKQPFPKWWHKACLSVFFFLYTIRQTSQAISMPAGLYKWYSSSSDFQILILLSAYFLRKTRSHFPQLTVHTCFRIYILASFTLWFM